MIDLVSKSLDFLFGCVNIFTRLSPRETRIHKAVDMYMDSSTLVST